MNNEVEIISIAIPTKIYNRNIASLVENLLLVDQVLFPGEKTDNPTEAA